MADDFEPSRELCEFLDGKVDRTNARQFWEGLAAGEFHQGNLAFVQEIARRMIEADTIKAGDERETAIVKASGLFGTRDKNRQLRKTLEMLDSISAIGEDGEPLKERPPKLKSGRKVVDLMRLVGDIPDSLTDETADRRIRDVRKTMRKPR